MGGCCSLWLASSLEPKTAALGSACENRPGFCLRGYLAESYSWPMARVPSRSGTHTNTAIIIANIVSP